MIASVKDPRSFEELRTNAKTFRSGPVSVRYLGDRSHPPRIAFAIGRRYGNAVARNRARRRVAALFREAAMRDSNIRGTFLISVRLDLRSTSHRELQESVSDLLTKASQG